jgi:hypothetical protein
MKILKMTFFEGSQLPKIQKRRKFISLIIMFPSNKYLEI